VKLEEERFGATLTVGLNKLDELVARNQNPTFGVAVIDSVELARLYDTFGTPIDLMYVIMVEGKHKLRHLVELAGVAQYLLVDVGEELSEEEFRNGIERLLKKLQENETGPTTKQQIKTKPVYVALSRRTDTKA